MKWISHVHSDTLSLNLFSCFHTYFNLFSKECPCYDVWMWVKRAAQYGPSPVRKYWYLLMTINNYYPMKNSNCQTWSPSKICTSKRVIPCFMATCQLIQMCDSLAIFWIGQISSGSSENLTTFCLVLLFVVSLISCSICSRYWGLSKCNSYSHLRAAL